jgi:hypothetical protein
MTMAKNHFDGFCDNFSNPHNLQQTLFFSQYKLTMLYLLLKAFGDSRVTWFGHVLILLNLVLKY